MLQINDDPLRAYVVYVDCPTCGRVNQIFRSTYMLLLEHMDDGGVFVCANKNGSETHDISIKDVLNKKKETAEKRRRAFNKGISREAISYIKFCLKNRRRNNDKEESKYKKKQHKNKGRQRTAK